MESSSSVLQRNIYDKHAYEEADELKDLKVREIVKKLGGDKCKILDVGCGDGSLLKPFCKDYECYGVDISEAKLKLARSRGIRTFCVNLEVDKLPFPNEYFDLVVCSETIEHLYDV
ncbi:MAG: class I SAM-dependent methyltransferase, partial [Conexivisphaerales archaeon]